jgi:hypothetical protein
MPFHLTAGWSQQYILSPCLLDCQRWRSSIARLKIALGCPCAVNGLTAGLQGDSSLVLGRSVGWLRSYYRPRN